MPPEAPSKQATAKRGLPPDLKRLGQLQAVFEAMDPDEAERALVFLADKYGAPKRDNRTYDPMA